MAEKILGFNTWFCPSCGEKNDGKFCTNCGARRVPAQQSPTVSMAGGPFLGEGHGGDFPPLQMYIKTASEVSDRHLQSLVLSSRCFNVDQTDGFCFSALPGCEEAVSLNLKVAVSELTGEKRVSGEVCARPSKQDSPLGMMGLSMMAMGGGNAVRKVDYPLAEELEEELAAVLLSPAVLERNPFHEKSDMCPTVYFALEGVFVSGERISMDSRHGIPIGNAAIEMARLLLFPKEK